MMKAKAERGPAKSVKNHFEGPSSAALCCILWLGWTVKYSCSFSRQSLYSNTGERLKDLRSNDRRDGNLPARPRLLLRHNISS